MMAEEFFYNLKDNIEHLQDNISIILTELQDDQCSNIHEFQEFKKALKSVQSLGDQINYFISLNY